MGILVGAQGQSWGGLGSSPGPLWPSRRRSGRLAGRVWAIFGASWAVSARRETAKIIHVFFLPFEPLLVFFFCGLLGACSRLLGWLKAVAGACGRKKSLGFLGRSRRPPGVPFGFFQGFPGRGQIRGGHGPHRATRSPRWHNIWASCGPVGTSSYRIVVNCCPFLSVPVINSCPFPSLPWFL